MSQEQQSNPYSWKSEADLTDLYREAIIRATDESIADLDRNNDDRHYRDELDWAKRLFVSSYDQLNDVHILSRMGTDPSAANHLKHLLGSLIIAASVIGGRSTIGTPASDAAKALSASRQARHARAAWQSKTATTSAERRRAIIAIAGGDDNLREGPKYAESIQTALQQHAELKKRYSGKRGFSKTSITREIAAILQERKEPNPTSQNGTDERGRDLNPGV